MAVVKNLMIRSGADFSSWKRETAKAQKNLSDFKKSTQQTMSNIKSAILAVGIGKLIKDSVSSAMGVEASIQQIDRIMGEDANTFRDWANNQAIAFNMSKSEALKYGAIYGNLISGFSKDTSETTKYTEELLKSSAVVASATGRKMEDVMERIRSGMLGNTEAIEDLGINVNVAMIESTDAFKKFANGKSWDQLSFQTQQQIRLMAILEQSNKKYGDSIRQNTNSQQQYFIAQLKNIQLSLGQAFLPIYNIILPALSALASKIAYVVGVFSQFSQALFGKQNKEAQNQVKTTTKQATAVSELGKAYKEAKGALAGFDEINQIQENTAAGAESPEDSLVAVEPPLINEAGTVDSESSAISQSITDMANKVKAALAPIKAYIAEIVEAFNAFGRSVQPYLQPIVDFIKRIFAPVWEGMKDLIFNIFQIIKEIIKGALLIIEGVIKVFAWILTGDWEACWQGLKDILSGELVIIKAVVNGALNFIQTSIEVILGVIKALWETVWNSMSNFASEIWQAIKNKAVSIWTPISTFFKSTWEGIRAGANKAWESIKSYVSGVWNWLGTKATEVFTGIKDSIISAFTSVGNTVKSIWDGIKTSIKNSINSIIETINSFIKGINGIKIQIPEVDIPLLGKVGGGTVSFPQIPELPLLAKGGITNGPMAAIVGDNPGGKEVISPLNELTDMIASAVGTAMISAMQFNNNSGNNGDIILNLDGNTFARIVKPYLDRESQRLGNNILFNSI